MTVTLPFTGRCTACQGPVTAKDGVADVSLVELLAGDGVNHPCGHTVPAVFVGSGV